MLSQSVLTGSETAIILPTDNAQRTVIYNPTIISDGRELHQLSNEELSFDTPTLLQIVLNSEYIRIAHTSSRLLSSSLEPLPTRYFEFNGFTELLKRTDLESALTSYVDSASDWEYAILQDMLANSEMKETVSTAALEYITSTSALKQKSTYFLTSIPDPLGFDNGYGITFSRAGSIVFVGNQRVLIYRASREYTATEQAEVDAYYKTNNSSLAAKLIFSADISYNCHSYAWHLMDNSNSCWIRSSEMFIPNAAAPVATNDIQEKDIIVYYDASNEIVHSAVVVAINGSTIIVQSKWGQAGVYQHEIGSVPSDYLGSGNTVNYSVYRYHNYSRTTTDLGHNGIRHSYKHTDYCDICLNTIITTVNVVCSGPPCISPFSMKSLST